MASILWLLAAAGTVAGVNERTSVSGPIRLVATSDRAEHFACFFSLANGHGYFPVRQEQEVDGSFVAVLELPAAPNEYQQVVAQTLLDHWEAHVE